MRLNATLLVSLFAALAASAQPGFTPSGELEIHYINVGQGGCTLIIGPNGTRILYDFGKSRGDRDIVPYLRDVVGLPPEGGLHFTIVSHRDTDHYVGYREVIEAGYDVLVANYDPGSPKDSIKIRERWLEPAAGTTAGAVRPIPVGLPIALGDGAVALVVAANGVVLGDPSRPNITNENDRSVALFVTYGDFQYVLDGDLGGGPESCSSHDTSQQDVQTRVARSLLDLGLVAPDRGVDVVHVAHHGSESSTPARYFNLMRPEIGLISVGVKQGSFLHPRKDVVDAILLEGPERRVAECDLVDPLIEVFQTEDGKEGTSSTGSTSFRGKSIGNIKLTTDGQTGYRIIGDGVVHEGGTATGGPVEFLFSFDEP